MHALKSSVPSNLCPAVHALQSAVPSTKCYWLSLVLSLLEESVAIIGLNVSTCLSLLCCPEPSVSRVGTCRVASECRSWLLPFLSPRFPLEWHSDRTCNTIGARNRLQCGHQLWSLQDYLSDLQLWKQGHILLCPCCGTVFISNPQARSGQTASSHFRDSLSDEQRPATEVCSVFDHSAPHRSLANCSEASRWNSLPEFRNQPSSWWVWQMM